MPIFNFTCAKCGKSFETLLKNSSESAACPVCGSKKVKKELNRISVGRASSKGSCPHEAVCPGAAAHTCGCGCGCGHKH